MIQKINLRESVNALTELFRYKRVGTLNNHMLNVLQAENFLINCKERWTFIRMNIPTSCSTALKVNLTLNSRTG